MSEETGAAVEQQPVQQQADQFETRARANGWLPENEFRGDPEDWVDAKEFVTRERPSYAHVREVRRLGQTVQELTTAKDVLVNHVRKLQEMTATQRIEALQTQKDDAVSEGNTAEVRKLDAAIEEIRKEEKLPDVATAPALDPVLTAWVEAPERDWYRADPELRVVAAEHQDRLLKSGLSVADSLARADSYVRKFYPERFRPADSSNSDGNGAGADNGKKPAQQQQPRRTPVASGGSRAGAGASRGITVADLSPLQAKVMAGFERDGIMTADQYLASLNETAAKGVQK